MTKLNMVKIEKKSLTSKEIISKIYRIRGEKMILDEDLASLYGVEVKRLDNDYFWEIRRNTQILFS